jgi:nucleotide-binding universal stress UspA family protein
MTANIMLVVERQFDERNARLIVVGARHERSIADRLLGTVATEVTKQAPCDVLIVRPTRKGEHVILEDTPTAPLAT